MKIDVASAIEEILDRREAVTLAGLGSLRLDNLSAKISDDGKTLTPPSVILSFYEVQTNNKPLRKYLSNKYDLSKSQAQKVIKKFSQSVFNSYANYGEVLIEGIAEIKKNKGKVRVYALDSFISKYYHGLPTVNLDETGSKSASESIVVTKAKLPANRKKAKAAKTSTETPEVSTVKLTSPAATSLTDKAKIESTKTESTKTKSPLATKPAKLMKQPPKIELPQKQTITLPKPIVKKPEIIPNVKAEPKVESTKALHKSSLTSKIKSVEKPAVKTVSAIVPTVTNAIAKKAETTKQQVQASSTQPVKVEKPTSEPMNLNERLARQSAEIGKTNHSAKASVPVEQATNSESSASNYIPTLPKKEKFGCLGPFLGLLGLALFCFLIWKGISCLAEKGKAKQSAQVAMVDDSNEGTIDTTAQQELSNSTAKNTDLTSHSLTASVDQDQCIIIVGSYSSYLNVKRMEDKIMGFGYQPYSEEYGPYTRVGFSFDCKGKDLAAYLHDIRDRIDSAAWYLKPDLYVAYN